MLASSGYVTQIDVEKCKQGGRCLGKCTHDAISLVQNEQRGVPLHREPLLSAVSAQYLYLAGH